MIKNKLKEGFIVHPYETGNSKYHASYGNNNKTVKSFNTLRQAKKFLNSKGIKTALYDSPSGPRNIKIIKKSNDRIKNKGSNPYSLKGFKLGGGL